MVELASVVVSQLLPRGEAGLTHCHRLIDVNSVLIYDDNNYALLSGHALYYSVLTTLVARYSPDVDAMTWYPIA